MRWRWIAGGVIAAGMAGISVFGAASFFSQDGGRAAQPSDHDRTVDGVVSAIDDRPRSDFQDALLRDGNLSEAEYDLAFERYARCVVDSGGEINGPGTKTSRGVYDFWVGVPPAPGGGPDREVQAAVAACSAMYWDVVGPRWSATRMAPREEFAAAFASVPGCMRAGGVEPPGDLTEGWGRRYVETASKEEVAVFLECVRAANRALGLPSNLLSLP